MLRRSVGGAAALAGSSWLLAACGRLEQQLQRDVERPSAASSSDLPIASKDRPITLPIFSDNKPIASGRSPEKGPLIIYDWALLPQSGGRQELRAEVRRQRAADDVRGDRRGAQQGRHGRDHPGRLGAGLRAHLPARQSKLIQPINHSYIPNLDTVIPAAADPWYDKGAQYTSPNYINTFGIGWRNDLVKIDPAKMSNPWDVFWEVRLAPRWGCSTLRHTTRSECR